MLDDELSLQNKKADHQTKLEFDRQTQLEFDYKAKLEFIRYEGVDRQTKLEVWKTIPHEIIIKIYSTAIRNGNFTFKNDFVDYCDETNDYTEFVKSFEFAANNGYGEAMLLLGVYYQFIDINDILMKKYHFMAINKKYIEAIYYLALYHQEKGNYEIAKKCFIMHEKANLYLHLSAMKELEISIENFEKKLK